MKTLAIIGTLALTSCATTPKIVYRDVPVEVKVPVAQPCVAGTRAAAIVPLNKQYSAETWKALDPKQKAAIVAKQAFDRQTWGENINAATASCP